MIKINNKISFTYKKPPLIIAEISGNHNGDKKRFLNLIKSACKNGADLIKIQTYEPSDITLDSKKSFFKIKSGLWKNKFLWNLYKKACTPYKWHHDAFKIAQKYNKVIFSSPFSKKGVDFLEKLKVPLYKIASFEITDLKLIKYIAEKNKPIILSTGMASLNEIQTALKLINKYHKKVIILHCVSGYPTQLEDTNLNRINELKRKFKNYCVGVSDHTQGISSSIASTSLGVVAIEKHFKLDEKLHTTDSKFSITPSKLLKLKNDTKKIHQSLFQRKISKNEKISRKLRRSIFAIKDIAKNEIFTDQNIDTFRPEIGISSSKFFDVLGKKSKKKIEKGMPIRNSYLS
ncbi:pseudaminic acid synthase [Candidatus Pelagibacter sp.]|nr:pseudaminic acid synthase [Candidatus Pelagibacter sp.]MDC1049419.1 pseudaminic acid synthase [Candidatus Pelagibacter sp.]